MDENIKYVQDQVSLGVLPTEIVNNLVKSGWNQLQATQLVQEVTGVQMAVAAPPGVYLKPPLILRILYIFSFLYLLLAIIVAAATVAALGAKDPSVPAALPYVLFVLSLMLFANFIFIRKLKSGSLAALKVYTLLAIGGVLLLAYASYSDSSDPAQALSASVAPNIIPILIILYLWTKHRRYFR